MNRNLHPCIKKFDPFPLYTRQCFIKCVPRDNKNTFFFYFLFMQSNAKKECFEKM